MIHSIKVTNKQELHVHESYGSSVGKKCNDRQNAYIQRMHSCTSVSNGQIGKETDRKETKTNR